MSAYDVGRPCPLLRRSFVARLVEASTVLKPNEKRLYRAILELDRPKPGRPGGCFASRQRLAIRLGLDPDTVSRHRHTLLRYGLLLRADVGGKRDRWFPIVPDGVMAAPPDGIKPGRATEAWLMQDSYALDDVLASRMHLTKAGKRPDESRYDHPKSSGSGPQIVRHGKPTLKVVTASKPLRAMTV